MPPLISFGSSQLLDDDGVQAKPLMGASAGLQGPGRGAGGGWVKKVKERERGERKEKFRK